MQIFMNLVNNVVQAMPDGGDVSVSVKHNGKTIEFKICDTGEGIPKESITKVFDPFFSTKRPGRGTGLGLAICQRIMENHKGTIRIESELGKRTLVIGELPALRQLRKG